MCSLVVNTFKLHHYVSFYLTLPHNKPPSACLPLPQVNLFSTLRLNCACPYQTGMSSYLPKAIFVDKCSPSRISYGKVTAACFIRTPLTVLCSHPQRELWHTLVSLLYF